MVLGIDPFTEISSPADDPPPTVRATVGVGAAGTRLAQTADELLVRVVVDNHLNLPGMVELTFLDMAGTALGEAGLTIGTRITVAGGTGTGVTAQLIDAEITAIEGSLSGQTAYTTVRGYTAAHRLQRARRSRTFLNVSDADVATRIAKEAGLTVGTVTDSGTTRAYVAQVNQTDWEFLTERALEIGYEVAVTAGVFHFRPSPTVAAPTTPGVATLTFRQNLLSFDSRLTAGNVTPDVEVRVWDPLRAQAFATNTTTPAGGATTPNSLGAEFTGKASPLGKAGGGLAGTVERAVAGVAAPALRAGLSAAGLPGMSGGSSGAAGGGGLLGAVGKLAGSATGLVSGATGAGALGPAPSPTAHVVADRPVADGTTMTGAGPGAAAALGSDLGSTFAEAEGDAVGDPRIQPGAVVEVGNVEQTFNGAWLVSHARHVFDDREYGYHTVFAAHGRQDRTMLGLTSKSATSGRAKLDGVVCGLISNNLDPLGRARVKVVLPWLSPDFETDWAPVAQFHAGPRSGALFVPEVGDEVLLSFEFGDPRRPYVIGSVVNNHTAWTLATAGGGPLAALSALAGGLGGSGGEIAGIATGLESLASSVAALTPAGQVMGATGLGGPAMQGGAPGIDTSGGLPPIPGLTGTPGTGAGGSLGAVQQSPGMVGEVVRSGFVTSTGNALLFNDQPVPGLAGGLPGLGGIPGLSGGIPGVGGTSDSGDGKSGSGVPGVPGIPGMPGGGGGGMPGIPGLGGGGIPGLGGGGGGAAGPAAIASSITLGAQSGNHGLYIDQVASTVILQANATPGVSASQLPMLVITTGPNGNVIINGGESLTLASEKAITMVAPEILVAGETITVAGELIPLTPG